MNTFISWAFLIIGAFATISGAWEPTNSSHFVLPNANQAENSVSVVPTSQINNKNEMPQYARNISEVDGLSRSGTKRVPLFTESDVGLFGRPDPFYNNVVSDIMPMFSGALELQSDVSRISVRTGGEAVFSLTITNLGGPDRFLLRSISPWEVRFVGSDGITAIVETPLLHTSDSFRFGVVITIPEPLPRVGINNHYVIGSSINDASVNEKIKLQTISFRHFGIPLYCGLDH